MSRSAFILCLNARRLPGAAHWARGWSATPREEGGRPIRQPAAVREPALHRSLARHGRRIPGVPRPQGLDHRRGGLPSGEARLGLLPQPGPGVRPRSPRVPSRRREREPRQVRPQAAFPTRREASRSRPHSGEAHHQIPSCPPGLELRRAVLAAQPHAQAERQRDPRAPSGPRTHADRARRELPQPPRLVKTPSHDLTVNPPGSRFSPTGAQEGDEGAPGEEANWRGASTPIGANPLAAPA